MPIQTIGFYLEVIHGGNSISSCLYGVFMALIREIIIPKEGLLRIYLYLCHVNNNFAFFNYNIKVSKKSDKMKSQATPLLLSNL